MAAVPPCSLHRPAQACVKQCGPLLKSLLVATTCAPDATATSRISHLLLQDAASGAAGAASEAAGSAAGAVRSTEGVGEAQRPATESGGAQPRLAGGVPAVQHGVS